MRNKNEMFTIGYFVLLTELDGAFETAKMERILVKMLFFI